MTERPQGLAVTPHQGGTNAVGGPRSGGVLDATLDQLRLEGAIFFRSELTEAFAFESTPLALADALHPGAQRLILFHMSLEAHAGSRAMMASATGRARGT